MTKHRDMKALAGAGRLVKAVETFLLLRRTIFPSVHGDVECAALQELETALKDAGGRVLSAKEKIQKWVNDGVKLEAKGDEPVTVGRWPKKLNLENSADWDRETQKRLKNLWDWAMSPGRKPAVLMWTSGGERQIGDLVEFVESRARDAANKAQKK